jgi:hypothetical protein
MITLSLLVVKRTCLQIVIKGGQPTIVGSRGDYTSPLSCWGEVSSVYASLFAIRHLSLLRTSAVHYLINEWHIYLGVKYGIGTRGLRFLFFAICASIHITDDIWVMEKDKDGTFIQKLTVVHVSTLGVNKSSETVIWQK